MATARRRPAGITIVSILAFAAGAIYLLQGARILGFVVFGPAQAFSSVSLTGWLMLITGLAWFAAGAGFWTLKVWAWFFGVAVVAISLVEAFLGNVNGWQFGDMFAAMIVPLVVLFYLNSEGVKRSFDGLEN